jgi:hypothetical protein
MFASGINYIMSTLGKITRGVFAIFLFAFTGLGILVVEGKGNWLPPWAFWTALITLPTVILIGIAISTNESRRYRRSLRTPTKAAKFSVIDERFNSPH